MKINRLLVAGATGYLGRHVVAACAQRGIAATALVRGGKTVEGAAEVREVDVTDPETLRGVADGHDAVFSALGITRQTDRVTFEDIDYTANLNMLTEARRAGVGRFGVISVARPEAFAGLAICDHRERFVAELQGSGVAATVVRATGFFSDMAEVFEMAARGRVFLIGDGTTRVNPVHGADLAETCLDAMLAGQQEVVVGGPETFSWNEVAALAFDTLGKPARVTRVPLWALRGALPLVRPFHRRAYDIGSFIVRGAAQDVVAPHHGSRTLRSAYEELANA